MKYKLLTVLISLLPTLSGAGKTLPDSLLTISSAYNYNLVSLDTSLAIVQTLRDRKALPDWLLDATVGDLYYNTRQFRKSMPFYEKALASPAIADSSHQQINLLKRMMDISDVLLEEDRLMYYIDRLHDEAIKHDETPYLAMAEFMLGKRRHYHGDTLRGYQYCRQAISRIKTANYASKQIELRSFYADMVRMYVRDGRFDEALEASRLQEKAALTPSGLELNMGSQRALRRVYALRASLLSKAGRMDEADEAYAQWLKTEGGNAIDDKDILDYMFKSHKNEEALDIVHRYRDFMRAECDTINYSMLDILNKDVQLHAAIGDFESSAKDFEEIRNIVDSLKIHESRGAMTYTYNLIKEEKASHRRLEIIIVLSALALVLIIAIASILYYNHIIRQRNKKLRRILNGLEAYRKMVNAQTESPFTSKEKSDESKAKATMDEYQRMFVELDARVTSEKPFLDPSFDHQELIRFSGFGEERFNSMITHFSDVHNTISYINSRRAEYAAQLIIEHPHDSIDTIARSSGFRDTGAFVRAFKFAFGFTPSEYCKSMSQMLKERI